MARTITWNEYIQPTHIYTASSAGTVFSANRNTTAAFAYFTNTAVVNDAVYFSQNYGYRFGGVKLTVGTAFAATSKTLVWEYWNGSAWTALSGVVDGTSGLTTLGVGTVNWTIPTNWQQNTTVNGIANSYCWVRCRLSAVSGITNGGANATTAPTIESRAITISDPGTTVTDWPSVLYAADVAGGWGVVTKVGTTGYAFNCHILIGYSTDSSTTALTATKNYIEIAGLLWQRKNVAGSGYITFGTLVSDTDRTSKDGCYVKCSRTLHNNFADGTSNEQVVSYSSVMDYIPFRLVKTYNSVQNVLCFFGGMDATNGPIVSNTIFQNARPDFITFSTFANTYVNKMSVSGSAYTLRFEFSAFVKGLVNLGCTYLGDCNRTQSVNTVLIDPVTSTFNIYWGGSAGSYGNRVSVRYSNSWVIKDSAGSAIQDVNVWAKDANGNPAIFVENGRSTGSFTDVSATLTVDTNSYAVGDYVSIGSEVVRITAGTYPTFTVARAQLGTLACIHPARQILKGFVSEATSSLGKTSLYLVDTKSITYASGSAPGITTVTEKGPFTFKFRKYGYVFYEESVTLTAPLTDAVRVLAANPFIVASAATAAAYTGIALDGSAKTVTVTVAHTVQEIYDYIQWWASQPANISYSDVWEYDGETLGLAGYTLTGIANVSGRVSNVVFGLATPGTVAITVDSATVDFSATGSYDLRTSDITGTVTLTNSIGGAVTVRLLPTVAYVNTGPSITVDARSLVALTAANIPTGASAMLRNETQDTEIDLTIGTAGTYSQELEIGVDAAVGDTLSLRAFQASGTTYSTYYQWSGVVPAAGGTLSVIEPWATWPEASALGIDGSAVLDFHTDYTEIEIDIVEDPPQTWWGKDMAAFILYKTASEADGMRKYFGALTAQNASRWVIDVSRVDLLVDNLGADSADQTDEVVISRSDGANIRRAPTTGGGGIGIVIANDVASLLPVSSIAAIKAKTDGLPADTSATLTALSALGDDLEGRLTAVRAGLLDNLANLDATISSRMATFTYTAPDNAGIAAIYAAVDTEISAILAEVDTEVAAIKAKTDNMPVDTASALTSLSTLTTEIRKLLRNKRVLDPATGIETIHDDNGTALYTRMVYQDAAGTVPYADAGADRVERYE